MNEIYFIKYHISKNKEDKDIYNIIEYIIDKLEFSEENTINLKSFINNESLNRLCIIGYVIKKETIYPVSILNLIMDFEIIKKVNKYNYIDEFVIKKHLFNYNIPLKEKFIFYKNLMELKIYLDNQSNIDKDNKKLIFSNLLISNKINFTKINNGIYLIDLKGNNENIFKKDDKIEFYQPDTNTIFPKRILNKFKNGNKTKFIVEDLLTNKSTEIIDENLTDWYSKYNLLDSVSFIEDQEVFWVNHIKYDIKTKNYLYEISNNDDYIEEVLLEKSY